jgi:hypothetical protein
MLLHVVKPPRPGDYPTHNFPGRSLGEEVGDLLSFVKGFEELEAGDGPEIRRLATRGGVEGRPVEVDFETVEYGFRTKDTRLKFTQITIGVIEPIGFGHLTLVVPKAPWSAVASATAFGSAPTAAASLPHSKALRAFSWLLGARQPTVMSYCLGNTHCEIPRRPDQIGAPRNDSLHSFSATCKAPPFHTPRKKAANFHN